MKNKAFTLFEILLVLLLIGFIIGFSSYFYFNFFKSDFVIKESANFIITILNLARQKALVGEENDNWGVWFVNTTTQDYFYLFKGSTSSLRNRYELPLQVTFLDFSEKIVLFNKISGQTTSTNIKIGLNEDLYKTIKISTSGAIILE